MMKIKSSVIYVLVGVIFALVSCDEIDKDDRYIKVDAGIVTPPDNPDDPDYPTSVPRSVLIEDFTGQDCPNCPDAVPVIDMLEEAYPGRVVVVAIHSGKVLPASLGNMALQTELGEQYYKDAGSPAQPAGRIGGSSDTYLPTDWVVPVQNVLRQMSPVSLKIENVYDEASRKVSVSVNAYGVDDVSGSLQLWLIEDGIMAPQSVLGTVKMYEHNHVLRAAVNGAYGEPFTIAKGEEKTVDADAVLESHWVPNHMSVVAFVSNDAGVLHVVKAPIVVETDDNVK